MHWHGHPHPVHCADNSYVFELVALLQLVPLAVAVSAYLGAALSRSQARIEPPIPRRDQLPPAQNLNGCTSR